MQALIFVQPATVIAWRRRKFREHWARLSRGPKPGRPRVPKEVRELIQRISAANPLWGSPRILGELRKLGIEVAKSTVERYMVRRPRPRSQGWMAFLRNHLRDMVAIDFFVVPTARFKLLFVLVILAHFRRQVVHFNVTTNPTAQWVAQQIIEAFPWNEAPRYLLRDRHATYGYAFRKRVGNMGIEEVLTAPRSPWQNPYVERLIGSVRRECLDNVVILNERHLRRVLKGYFDYHQRWRTHLSLAMDCPQPRAVQHPSVGYVVELPEVGGLHHHYERRAA
jgi:transposase InsO family protein